MDTNLDQIVLEKAQKWLTGNYDEKPKQQVKLLIASDKKE